MLDDDRTIGETLGLCRTDVILVHDVKQLRAHNARSISGRNRSQRNGRKHIVHPILILRAGTAGTRNRHGDCTARGVLEDDAKEQLQQHTEPEGRDRNEDRRGERYQNIPEGITLYRRNDTRTDTHNCLEHDGARGKFDRIRILLGKDFRNRQLALIRIAQIAMKQAVHVIQVTVHERRLNGVAVLVKDRVAVLVRLDQVIADAKLKLHLGGQSLVSTDQLDRISRHDILEGEQNQRNAQKHRDELKHTFNDVLTHTTPLSRD